MVFEVGQPSDVLAADRGSVRGVIDWKELHNDRIFYEMMYLVSEFQDQGRSISTDAYILQHDGTFQRLPMKFNLSDDGRRLEFRYFAPFAHEWEQTVANKVRAGTCGETVPYVARVKAALEKKSGITTLP